MTGRIFFLNLEGRVLSANADGSGVTVIVQEGRELPDGLAVDVAARHLYWTNMGNPKANDGSILRCTFEGGEVTPIVRSGVTFTPKQLQLDHVGRKLYWSDREGMRVMRANLDGSAIETLVDASAGDKRPGADARKWCVGIAVDLVDQKFYWTQKGGDNAGEGRICRANLAMPAGETATARTDIELLYENLPEPIDLELDTDNRMLYWTDRGDPPRGNTVNRAPLEASAGIREPPQILVSHLMEAIGLALDRRHGRMFITDLGGSVYCANLDGSECRTLLFAQGNLSGIAYVNVPSEP